MSRAVFELTLTSSTLLKETLPALILSIPTFFASPDAPTVVWPSLTVMVSLSFDSVPDSVTPFASTVLVIPSLNFSTDTVLPSFVYVDGVCDLKRERFGTELRRVYGVYKIGVL